MYCHKKFYSLKQMFGKVLAGQWLSVGVAQLKLEPGARISVDYREEVSLDL